MNIIVHGGNNQIGGNCIEIAGEKARLLFDIGAPLGRDLPKFEEKPAKEQRQSWFEEGLLPEVQGLYAWEEPELDAIFISHTHVDHVGLASWVHTDIPIRMSRLSRDLLVGRLEELRKSKESALNVQCFSDAEPVEIGGIKITPYRVDHSALDAYAFLIQGEGKNILYTGDFRGHGRNAQWTEAMLTKLPASVDAVIMEGTNLGRTVVSVEEEQIEAAVCNQCEKTKGLVMGLVSTQHFDRILSFFHAALNTGRTLVIDPYQAHMLDIAGSETKEAMKQGRVKVLYSYRTSKALADSGHKKILYRYKNYKLAKADLKQNPHKYVLLVRSSMLQELEELELDDSSCLVYSMWRGYKEQPEMAKLLGFCEKKRVPVVDKHTSGHADIDTLLKVIKHCNPGMVIPVHTDCEAEFCQYDVKTVLPLRGKPISI